MAKRSTGNGKLSVSEHEGMVLSLVLRQQPATAYQLYRIFEESPVSAINASKGQLYPAIRRLKIRGLLKARTVPGDRRKAEQLFITQAGQLAVREWMKELYLWHINVDDPLRTRVLSFDVLTKPEQLEWLAKAKALVKLRRDIVDEYNRSVGVPYQEFIYRSVTEMLRVKMEWLDELLYHVAGSK